MRALNRDSLAWKSMLMGLLLILALCGEAEAAPPRDEGLPAPVRWKAEQVQTSAMGDAVKLTLDANYVIGRVVSPTVAARPGELFTLSAVAATRFAPAQGSFYRFYVEIECLQGERVAQTYASLEVTGTQEAARMVAVTALMPPGATAVRAVLCAQNKMWSVAENQALVRDVRLKKLDGGRGGALRVETLAGLPQASGSRTARVAVRGDWPDGSAVALSTTRGAVAPSLLLMGGRAESAVGYTADEVGAAIITARIADTRTTSSLSDPQAATLTIRSIEADGHATPALVQLTRDGVMIPGRYQASTPGICVNPPWSIDLAPGRWRLRVCRGPLFEAAEQTIDVARGGRITVDRLELKRRADLAHLGWYGGDADGDVYHGEQIYDDVTAEDAARIAEAMGLDWVGVASWRKPDPQTWGEARALMRSWSHPGFLFMWADERPKLHEGHACLVGMERPDADAFDWGWVRGAGHPLRNYEYLQMIRASGGATFANHPLRHWTSGGQFVTNMYSGLAFDLCAAGLLDGYNINEKPNDLAAWSMLLDHGYRVAATAGADFCLDRPNGPLPGASARMYCYCPDGMTAKALADAVRHGRTIVSTGPALLADIAGQQPGATLEAGKTYPVHVRAWARGDRPDALTSLELYAHGRVIAAKKLTPGAQEAEATFEWTPAGPWDWVAARAVAKDGWAMSSAFYAAGPQLRPPQPVQCKLKLNVTGLGAEELGQTEVEVWDQAPGLVTAKRLSRGPLPKGKIISAPVSATIVLKAPGGRRKEIAVYDALGMAEWIGRIASGTAQERPLLDWQTYEDCLRRCREATAQIEFQLKRFQERNVAP